MNCDYQEEACVKLVAANADGVLSDAMAGKLRRGHGEKSKTIRIWLTGDEKTTDGYDGFVATAGYICCSSLNNCRAFVTIPAPDGVTLTNVSVKWYRASTDDYQYWCIFYNSSDPLTQFVLDYGERPVGSGSTGWEEDAESINHILATAVGLQIRGNADSDGDDVRFAWVDLTYTSHDVDETY